MFGFSAPFRPPFPQETSSHSAGESPGSLNRLTLPPRDHLLDELEQDAPGLFEKALRVEPQNRSQIRGLVLNIGQLISRYVNGKGHVSEDGRGIAERNEALVKRVLESERKSPDQLMRYLEESVSLLRLLKYRANHFDGDFSTPSECSSGNLVFEPSKNLVALQSNFLSLDREFSSSRGVSRKEFEDLVYPALEAKLEDPDNLEEMTARYVKARDLFNKARQELGIRLLEPKDAGMDEYISPREQCESRPLDKPLLPRPLQRAPSSDSLDDGYVEEEVGAPPGAVGALPGAVDAFPREVGAPPNEPTLPQWKARQAFLADAEIFKFREDETLAQANPGPEWLQSMKKMNDLLNDLMDRDSSLAGFEPFTESVDDGNVLMKQAKELSRGSLPDQPQTLARAGDLWIEMRAHITSVATLLKRLETLE